MPVNYQSDTSPIYAGRFPVPLPSWATSAPLNQYTVVPLSVTLADLDTKNDPLINPNYPSNPEWYGNGHDSLVEAWCGGTNNTDGSKLYLPLGGGHGDYAGNEPYILDLLNETPSFVMLRKPSGAVGNLLTTNDGQEITGVYSDGRPRAVHSYDRLSYVDGVGPFLSAQGGQAWTATPANPSKTLKIDEITGETTFLADNLITTSWSGSGSCYDKSRHGIWYRRVGTSKMYFYDVDTNTQSELGINTTGSGGVTLQYIPTHDIVIIVSDHYTNGFAIFDCVTLAYTEPLINGSFVGNILQGGSKPVLVEHLGYLAFWDNTTDTTIINTMNIPANPRIDTWNVSQLTVDIGNTITPDTSMRATTSSKGTYGRFFYSTKFKGFFLYARYLSDLLFFKIEN